MDNELLLFDRIEVIKQTIAKYGEENFYISFSGGKDSTVLHHLVDLTLQEQLETMQRYLPNERKQCELIWQPVYAEYRRLGYRLEKEEQLKLF